MQIKAEELTIRDLLGRKNILFKVPEYQRPYSWGKSQWQDLWDDVINAEKDEFHYLGSIVAISGSTSVGDFDRLEIVDGQQRITTISILLSALRDAYKQSEVEGNEIAGEDIQRDLLTSKIVRKAERKLHLGKADDVVYERVWKGDRDKLESRVYEAYDYFSEQIRNFKDYDEIAERFSDGAQVVFISTPSHRNAFRLFETLNDRGLELSAADLIKNRLLSEAAGEGDEERESVVTIWEGLMDDLGSSDRINKIRFFRQYLLATKLGKISQSKLYDEFKDRIEDAKSSLGFAKELANAANLYRRLHEPDFESDHLNLKLNDLQHLGAVPAMTLLMRLLIDKWEESALLSVIRPIEAFSLRRSVCGWSTSEMDTLFNQIANLKKEDLTAIAVAQRLAAAMPGDDEFRTRLMENEYRQNDQTRYVLEMLERDLLMTSELQVGGSQSVHIEHILPQTIDSSRSKKTKGGDWIEYLGKDAEAHRTMHKRIGNLTLLAKELNIPASNNPFAAKKAYYAKSQFRLTAEVSQYEDWRNAQIEKRSATLADRSIKIWSISVA